MNPNSSHLQPKKNIKDSSTNPLSITPTFNNQYIYHQNLQIPKLKIQKTTNVT